MRNVAMRTAKNTRLYFKTAANINSAAMKIARTEAFAR